MATTLLNDTPEFQHFTCTSKYCRFMNLLLTDGAQHLAINYDCVWYFAMIAVRQPKLQKEEFQHWTLQRVKDTAFDIVVDDGNGNILLRESIEAPLFDADGVRLYVIDNVALLPSEY